MKKDYAARFRKANELELDRAVRWMKDDEIVTLRMSRQGASIADIAFALRVSSQRVESIINELARALPAILWRASLDADYVKFKLDKALTPGIQRILDYTEKRIPLWDMLGVVTVSKVDHYVRWDHILKIMLTLARVDPFHVFYFEFLRCLLHKHDMERMIKFLRPGAQYREVYNNGVAGYIDLCYVRLKANLGKNAFKDLEEQRWLKMRSCQRLSNRLKQESQKRRQQSLEQGRTLKPANLGRVARAAVFKSVKSSHSFANRPSTN